MNERTQQLAEQAGLKHHNWITNESNVKDGDFKYPRLEDYEKFAELIVRECIDKIETHRIPVGNSAAGEMACEWTYAALKEIRDDIKEHFGVKE